MSIDVDTLSKALARVRDTLALIGRADVAKAAIWGSPAGKTLLAERIVAEIPEHQVYVEPFAGGAAVLFKKESSETEVVNDIDSDIAFAFRYTKNITPHQIARLRRKKWVGDKEHYLRLRANTSPKNKLDRFYRFAYLSRFSFNGLRYSTMANDSVGVTAKFVDRLERHAPRLKEVIVRCEDYEKVIKEFDGPDTFFFLDPPYAGYDSVPTAGRKHKDWNEERFGQVLKKIKGKFLCTYGIRGNKDLFKGFHVRRWRHMSGVGTHRGAGMRRSVTQIITNYKPERKGTSSSLDKAQWSRKYINDLPDSAFLYIEPGGKKDEEDKTIPRNLRHFPIRNHKDELDFPHLRNAIARIPQSKIPGLDEDDLKKLQDKARALLAEAKQKRTIADGSNESTPFAKEVPIIKGADPEDERYVLGIVLEPETVDAQGDIYSAEEIRQAAHKFMEDYGGLGLMHRFRVNGDVKILESYLAPTNLKIANFSVSKGTWLLAVRILSDALWEQVKEGELSGFSIGGSARTEEISSPESQVSSEEKQVQKSQPRDSEPKTQNSIRRLLDILVEEVSLVDRAANKRRFLVVKRSDEMDADINKESTSADETETNGSDESLETAAAETEAGTREDGGKDEASGAIEDPLSSAVSALEQLTLASEALAALDEEEVKPQLASLATALRDVSTVLADFAGTHGKDHSDDPSNDSEEAAEQTGASGDRQETSDDAREQATNDVLASLNTTLSRIGDLLQASQKSGEQRATEKARAEPEGTSTKGDTLTSAVKALVKAVQTQQQRLARLEKRFGLPNSLPAGERVAKRESGDESWPLDLNNPMDRKSVDKAVSFHEL